MDDPGAAFNVPAMRTDSEVIAFLIRRHGSRLLAAEAIGLSWQQTLTNWEVRGIAPAQRYTVFKHCRREGLKLPEAWLAPPKRPKARRTKRK